MATISQYWVGQIPNRPIAINLKDSDGRDLNLVGYTEFRAIVLGSDNEQVDLTGSVLNVAPNGRMTFRFPADRSVFDKPGEYLLQLELNGPGARDYTTAHTIRVRRLGGKN